MVKIVPRGDTTMVDAYLTPHIQKFSPAFALGSKTAWAFWITVHAVRWVWPILLISRAATPSFPVLQVAWWVMQWPRNEECPWLDSTWAEPRRMSPVMGWLRVGHETETAGVRIQAPQMHIKTVAAGGGSRLFFRNGLFEVGPESAGAHPGPVFIERRPISRYRRESYARSVESGFLPENLRQSTGSAIGPGSLGKALDELTDEINTWGKSHGQKTISREEVALGFLKVANEVMIRPIREISVCVDLTLRNTP